MAVLKADYIRDRSNRNIDFSDGLAMGTQMAKAIQENQRMKEQIDIERKKMQFEVDMYMVDNLLEANPAGLPGVAHDNPDLISRILINTGGMDKTTTKTVLEQMQNADISGEMYIEKMKLDLLENPQKFIESVYNRDYMYRKDDQGRLVRYDDFEDKTLYQTEISSGAPKELSLTSNVEEGTPDKPIANKEEAKPLVEKIIEAAGKGRKVITGTIDKIAEAVLNLPRNIARAVVGDALAPENVDVNSDEFLKRIEKGAVDWLVGASEQGKELLTKVEGLLPKAIAQGQEAIEKMLITDLPVSGDRAQIMEGLKNLTDEDIEQMQKRGEIEDPEKVKWAKDQFITAYNKIKGKQESPSQPGHMDIASLKVEQQKANQEVINETSRASYDGMKGSSLKGYKLPISGYRIPEGTNLMDAVDNHPKMKGTDNDLDTIATANMLEHFRNDKTLFDEKGMLTTKGLEVHGELMDAIKTQHKDLFDDDNNYVNNRTLRYEIGEFKSGKIQVTSQRMNKALLVRETASILGLDKSDYKAVENALMIVNNTDDIEKLVKKGKNVTVPYYDIRSPALYLQAENKGKAEFQQLAELGKKTSTKIVNLYKDNGKMTATATAPREAPRTDTAWGATQLEARRGKQLYDEKGKIPSEVLNSYPVSSYIKTNTRVLKRANDEGAEKHWRYDFSNDPLFLDRVFMATGTNDPQVALQRIMGNEDANLSRLAVEANISETKARTELIRMQANEIQKRIELMENSGVAFGDDTTYVQALKELAELTLLEAKIDEQQTKNAFLKDPLSKDNPYGGMFYTLLDDITENVDERDLSRMMRKKDFSINKTDGWKVEYVYEYLRQNIPHVFRKIGPEGELDVMLNLIQHPEWLQRPEVKGGIAPGMFDTAFLDEYPDVKAALEEQNKQYLSSDQGQGATRGF